MIRAAGVRSAAALLAVLALPWLGGGCGSPAPETAPPEVAPAPAPAPKPPPAASRNGPPKANGGGAVKQHRWVAVTQKPAAPWPYARFGLYTYVIYTGPAAETPQMGSRERDAVRRFERLLAAVAAEGQAQPGMSAAERAVTNVFVVPLAKGAAAPTPASYDTALAAGYRLPFAVALAGVPEMKERLGAGREGPFLLTTRVPVGEVVRERGATFEVDAAQPILLVDLTGAHPATVAEVVGEFKRHVETRALTGSEALEPLRIKVVAVLLRLNDAIPFVATAVAGTTKLLGWDKPAGGGQ